MIIVEILIPITSNEAAVFTAEHHVAFEARLVAVFGGFSLLPGAVKGGWAHEGVVYTEEHRVYAVALVSITDGGKVREVVIFAKAHYAQIAIFFRYLGVAETM